LGYRWPGPALLNILADYCLLAAVFTFSFHPQFLSVRSLLCWQSVCNVRRGSALLQPQPFSNAQNPLSSGLSHSPISLFRDPFLNRDCSSIDPSIPFSLICSLIVWSIWTNQDSMGKESQVSAMDIDAPKPTGSDQIVPKFSVNGLSFPSLSNAVPFMFLPSFFYRRKRKYRV